MTSCQVQGASSESIMMDRFSDLPDEIGHHIISFLSDSLRNLIQVGAVSKRCRKLYLSVPSIIIDASSVADCTKLRVRLLNSWDRYLFHRGNNKIERLSIYWVFRTSWEAKISDEYFRVTTWIQNAVRCNVEVLHLDLNQYDLRMTVVLPSCIFLCRSLRTLSVNLYMGKIQSPNLSFSSNLHYLKLKYVRLKDDGIFKWISYSCKCIKELHLEKVIGIKDIKIESSSLESFSLLLPFQNYELWDLSISAEKLEDICIYWQFDSRRDSKFHLLPRIRSLNLFAPKLKKFKWSGNFLNHHHLGNLMCLEEADIFLMPDLDDSSNLFEVLCSICMVKVLTLNEETTKALCRGGSLPVPLDSIRYLSLHVTNLNADLVAAMVSIFRGITYLNTLCIMSDLSKSSVSGSEYDSDIEEVVEDNDTEEEDNETKEENATEKENNESRFNVEYWKSQNLTFIYQLKEVRIDLLDGNNELEFARYILENAPSLEKMVIIQSPQHSDVVEMVTKSKMMSNATVVLQERQSS
ncbi:F-box/LRR-repeat protein [Rosa sericea]